MTIVLGIESTAHTFGVGIVKDGKILANVKRSYTTEEGGIIPTDAAKHHFENKHEVYFEALDKSGMKEENVNAIAFSQGPGLAPCLLEGMGFAKELAERLKKPIVLVNHCIAHLEIGKITGARDPVMLYASGANTQIIAYASGKYRVFGETLDLGVGNFIDTFGRYAGLGFPAGPAIQKLASGGKDYIELPYKVKGMDIALSGILTNLRQKLGLLQSRSQLMATKSASPDFFAEKKLTENFFEDNGVFENSQKQNSDLILTTSKKFERSEVNYTLADLSYSLQETVFAMLVETAERALAHTGKKELLLGGGVACNTRLQEMCKIMCRERGAKFFCPENQFLVDNGGMIAYLGETMFRSQRDDPEGPKKIYEKDFDKMDIRPRERTDDVEVSWK